MKRFTLISRISLSCSLVIISLTAGAKQPEGVKKEFTLEECIALATENYPAVKRYGLIEVSKGLIKNNMDKSHMPQTTLSLKGSYQSDVTSVPILVPGMAIDPMSKDQYSAVLNVEQTIWDGGVAKTGKRQADIKAAYDKKEVDVEIYTLKERIQNLYFGTLLVESYLKEISVAQKEIDRIKERVEAYIESGVANNSDLDAVLVERISLMQRERELNSERKSYISMLSSMTGVVMDESTLLITPKPATRREDFQINRPELSLFSMGQELVNHEKSIVDSRNKPKFGAFVQLGYGRPGLNMLKDEFAGFYVAGVRMVWNIGSLYTTKNEKRLLDIRFSNIETQRETFLYNLNAKTAGTSEKMQKIKELLSGDEEMVKIRSRLADSALKKLEAGSISVSDYIKELNLLDNARCTKSRRAIELLMAEYELNYILNN
ncbi:MAG: TolC family protein [Bacteroidales bacterium]